MPARKRILYYSHTRQVSGGERVLLTMLQVLDREQYEPICACPFEGKGNLDELLREQRVEVIEAPILQARFTSNPFTLVTYLASFLTAIRRFRSTITKARPDLLHANSVRAGIVATLATLGTSTLVLWHIHDDLPAHPISTLVRQLAFRSRHSRFVSVSNSTARVFAERLPFGFRMQVLHNAIDTEHFERKSIPLDAEAEAFRGALSIGTDEFLVIAVGMINPRKGLQSFIEAFAKVQPTLSGLAIDNTAHLAIVGSPIFNDDHLYEQQLRSTIDTLGLAHRVHLTGQSNNVPAALRAADLFVLNAIVEPFGLVILEAMASGTAVLATAVGGIPEIIESGFNGELISTKAPGDSDLLAAQIAALLGHPETRKMYERNALADTVPTFSLITFSANLQALYTSLNLPDGSA